MKSTITLAAGLLFASTALAQPAILTTVDDGGSGGENGAAVSAQVDKLQAAVLAGNLSPRSFDAVKTEITQMGEGMSQTNPMAAQLGQRLTRRLADLQSRSQTGKATAQDFAILREQVIDTRIDYAISQIATSAKASSTSPEQFAQVSSLLQARGAASVDIDPQGAESNQSVILVVSNMQKKAGVGDVSLPDISALRSRLAEARLDRAMTDLQTRAVTKVASSEDYLRLNEVLADRTKVIGTPAAKQLELTLAAAIGELKAKAATGRVTKADFSPLQTDIIAKAREASGLQAR